MLRAAFAPSTFPVAVSSRLHLGRERRDVVRAVVAEAVDEERGRAGDAGQVGGLDVLRDTGRVLAALQLLGEAVDVEAELLGVPEEVGQGQLVAVGKPLRDVFGLAVHRGGLDIPVWVSWLALVVAGALAYFGFRQNIHLARF